MTSTALTGQPVDYGTRAAMHDVLQQGFREDIGFGDASAYALNEAYDHSGRFTAKSEGVLAGITLIELGYSLLDKSVQVTPVRPDGDRIRSGDTIARVTGPAPSLLTGERVILNLLQHLSGIATATARAVDNLQDSGTRICDTRKTLPGLRALQKYAVRCGGGVNHRLRLDDGVIIKDNHIAASGSIPHAVQAVRRQTGPMVRIEVECETEEQIRQAVEAGADAIMLDNRSPEQVHQLRQFIPGSVTLELSGGITPGEVAGYRDCGADFISIGALTHSVQALDIGFDLTRNNPNTLS